MKDGNDGDAMHSRSMICDTKRTIAGFRPMWREVQSMSFMRSRTMVKLRPVEILDGPSPAFSKLSHDPAKPSSERGFIAVGLRIDRGGQVDTRTVMQTRTRILRTDRRSWP